MSLQNERNPANDIFKWDEAAEAAGIDLREPGAHHKAAATLGVARPPGPYKYALRSCRSGKRDYCTCDGCF